MLSQLPSPARVILRGSVILLLSFSARVLLGIVRNAYIGQSLGAKSLGIFTLGFILFQLISILTRFGSLEVINRFLPEFLRNKDPQELARLLATSFKISLLLSLAGSIFLFISANFWEGFFKMPGLKLVLRILAFALPIQTINHLILATVTAREKVSLQAGINNIIFPLLFLVFTWALARHGFTLGAIAGGLVTASISSSLITIPLSKKFFPLPLKPKEIIRTPINQRFLTFALPLVLWNLLMFAQRSFDTLILGFFLNAQEVGIYSALLLLVGIPEYLLQAVNTISLPVFSRLISSRRWAQTTQLYHQTRQVLSLISLPALILILIFSKPLLSLFGPEFSTQPKVATILALGVLLNLSAGPVENLLTALDKQHNNLTNTLIAIIVGLIVGILIVPGWGIFGAALTRTLILGLENYLGVWQVTKVLQRQQNSQTFPDNRTTRKA